VKLAQPMTDALADLTVHAAKAGPREAHPW
jgi:hypothetical protein